MYNFLNIKTSLSSNRWASSEHRPVKLGDVVEVRNELELNPKDAGFKRYLKVEHLDSESLKIRRWGLIEEEDLPPTFYKVFRKSQVLYPTRNPHLRRTAFADFDGICGEKTLTLEANQEMLLPVLLPFIFQTEPFIQYATSSMIGSTNPHVRWRDIASYKFILPPKNEQQQIADILWAVDHVVQKFEIAYSQIVRLEQKSFDTWLNENKTNENWTNVSLEDICNIQNGQINPTVFPYTNMIHIAPDDIESITGNVLEKRTAAQDGVESGKYEFSDKAILYSKIRPNLRKVAFPRFSGICSADIYPIYSKNNVLPEFLFRLLLSEDFTFYAIGNSVRSAIPKINRQAFLRYQFKLPPLNEQRQFEVVLASFREAISVAFCHLSDSRSLKRFLLSYLLTR